MQEFQTLKKTEKIILELKKEIEIAVPKILRIRSSKLLKLENRISANSRIYVDRSNSQKKDAQKDFFFEKNSFSYGDVPIQKLKECSRTNITMKEYSFVLRLSANIENSGEGKSYYLNDDLDHASVKNESLEIFKNLCEKKLDSIVDNVSEILRLCDECQLASERIANERNNRYDDSYLSHLSPHYIHLTVLLPSSIF